MTVITRAAYNDTHTKIAAGIRLEVVWFGVGASSRGIIWCRKVDSNDASQFPVMSEFIIHFCEKI
jgi:hypothetical protein